MILLKTERVTLLRWMKSQLPKGERYLKVKSLIDDHHLKTIFTNSGFMVGLGETKGEVLQPMDDLRTAGCKVLTIGQYLQPASNSLPVHEYIRSEVFDKYYTEGLKRGFSFVGCSPLVRSTYHAERHVGG
jgi:lipoic acid synthetase